MGYILYEICGGIIFIAILVIISYRKKSQQLTAEEEKMRLRMQTAERTSYERIEKAEKESQDRIRAAEKALAEQQADFNQRVEKFTKEQKLREDIGTKSDRDIIIEMHVKEMRILDAISEINDKIIGVQNYSDKVEGLTSNMTGAVEELKESLSSSVEELQSELENIIDNLESTVEETISENVSDLDEDDIRRAVSNALDYDCYSFKCDLESMVKDAVESAIESGLNEILSSIESNFEN